MRFTMVNFVYLFYTIVMGFYLSKLLSVTSTIIGRKNEKKKKGEKRNSFFGYERGGSRKKNSYELQQLYTTKREKKTRAKHEQTKIQTVTPNQQKQRIHIVKRPKRKLKYVVISASGIWNWYYEFSISDYYQNKSTCKFQSL